VLQRKNTNKQFFLLLASHIVINLFIVALDKLAHGWSDALLQDESVDFEEMKVIKNE
jgi:hypothetical protein